MTPGGLAVAEVAKGLSRKRHRQWLAWDHDREAVARHAAQVRVAWRQQWPTGRDLAAAWRAYQPASKGPQDDRARRVAAAALAASWLYQHLKAPDRTLAALVAMIEEAYQLGRQSALLAVADAGLATPLGTQALEALEGAARAGDVQTITGTLQKATERQIARLGRALADDQSGESSLDDLAGAIDDLLGDGAWVDVLVSTEAQYALMSAASAVYTWAAVEFKEFGTAGDQLVCHECEDSEAEGPILAAQSFPYGDPPIHPNCRCAIFPLSVQDLGPGGLEDVLVTA